MSVLVANCPRCKSQYMTFDVRSMMKIAVQYGWQRWYEAFGVCRSCKRGTIFVLRQRQHEDGALDQRDLLNALASLDPHLEVDGFICLKDMAAESTPEYVEPPVSTAFHEGAVSVVVGNWNAAGTMFRLAIDLASKPLLPEGEVEGLNSKTRRDLGLRLPWLFANGLLPNDLRELSTCVHQDGNDGAHAGTLTREDAQDLLDFARALLERIITEPARLRLARERRDQRRAAKEQ
jgi:Domain of unknown function (DUF4145)